MRNVQSDNYFNLVLFTSKLYFYWSIVFYVLIFRLISIFI